MKLPFLKEGESLLAVLPEGSLPQLIWGSIAALVFVYLLIWLWSKFKK